MATRARPARERLLRTASDLFYREGIRAVGVDRIAAESHIAKTTIYEHFASKDELVAACLRRRDAEVRTYLERVLAEHAGPPRDRILSVFAFMAEWVARLGFRGCGFMNASIELADSEHPAKQAVVDYKNAMLGILARLCTEARYREPEKIAEELELLLDGAFATSVVWQDVAGFEIAKRIADGLLPEVQ